jgi:2-hydroxychromene-2-carboxylate isomerase
MGQVIRFYFSFRSPYAWFAAERWKAVLGDLNVGVERIPFYPTPDTFPNDPTRIPNKYRYVMQDVLRIARDFGLTINSPPALDTDWARAHAAYLGIETAEPERAESFALEMFRSRFSRGLDVALDATIADAAVRAGVNVDRALQAASSASLQALVAGNFVRGQERDGIFGAPSFVYQEQLFWGHDRMHQLHAAVAEGISQ